MSREIKFRGIDANGVMRYGRLSQDKLNSTAYYDKFAQRICWDDSNIPVSNETLGQYVGLKDKNGVEIYDGDILSTNKISLSEGYYNGKGEVNFRLIEMPNPKLIVKYNPPKFELMPLQIYKTSESIHVDPVNWGYKQWIVLGNIWENSELLNIK